jgi:uncharacterized protein YbjT (DUF2867 family)
MARTLTVSRVSVRPGSEAEYLAAVRELAALADARGWHLWVFRRPDQAGAFLEFSESRSRETHRAVAARPPDERELEARLRAVAEYQPGAWELWEEVR